MITREQWGALPPVGPLTSWRDGQPTSWTLHYEGVDSDTTDNAERVRSIQQYHQTHGYYDIAYNWLVASDGTVYEGRGGEVRSAAQASGNPVSFAVCYLGGPSTPLTNEAKRAINALIAQQPLPVFPHRQWIATACPGDVIAEWIAAGRPEDDGAVPPVVVDSTPPAQDARPMVRPGAQGSAVVEMQQLLARHGFDCGPIDGVYGPQTGAALRAFQQAQNIPVDGICGPITWSKLDDTVSAPTGSQRLLRQGDRGADVAELQEALYRSGNDAGPADGVFGRRTDWAVRSLQQSRDLTVDGIVGPQTRAALGI